MSKQTPKQRRMYDRNCRNLFHFMLNFIDKKLLLATEGIYIMDSTNIDIYINK